MTSGQTPLHVAVIHGHGEVVKVGRCVSSLSHGEWLLTQFLLHRGADINEADFNGQTPLDLATDRGHRKLVKVGSMRLVDVSQGMAVDAGPP